MPFRLNSVLLFCVVLVTLFNYGDLRSCIYGSDSSCLFPCHCNNLEDCDSVQCQNNECEKGVGDLALDNTWYGPNCQIGNVALRKPATQRGKYEDYAAERAVDGILKSPNYAFPHIDYCDNGLAWWQVDLQDRHVVEEVKIYSTNLAAYYQELAMISILIGMRSDTYTSGKLCATREEPVPLDSFSTIPLDCHQPVITRYLAVKRYAGFQTGCMRISEVVVKGYKYVNPCPDGTYGYLCHLRCDQCKYSNCSRKNGFCDGECKPFHYTAGCSHVAGQINAIPATEYRLQVTAVTDISVEVKFAGEQNVSSEAMKFYFYVVHVVSTKNGSIIRERNVPHDSADGLFTTVIGGLDKNSAYEVYITPQRRDQGVVEKGTPTNKISFRTSTDDCKSQSCLAPIICLTLVCAILIGSLTVSVVRARQLKITKASTSRKEHRFENSNRRIDHSHVYTDTEQTKEKGESDYFELT